jgi:hypothetical protein
MVAWISFWYYHVVVIVFLNIFYLKIIFNINLLKKILKKINLKQK